MKNDMLDVENSQSRYLIEIIRAALTGSAAPLPPQDMDWQAFFELSKKQEIYSLVAAAVDKSLLPRDIAQQLDNYSKSELVRMIAMQNELAAIKAQLDESGINYMLLKGAVIRNYYPKQSMRQMSDIDILYSPASKREELIKLMKRRGYKLISSGGNSDDFTKAPYYTFELHRELFKNEYGFFPDFSFVWQNASRLGSDSCEYEMKREDLYLHHIAHMYKHGMLGGFGVRFLADLYLICAKCGGALDFDYISGRLEKMGLSDFARRAESAAKALAGVREMSVEDARFISSNCGFGIYGSGVHGVELLYEEFEKNSGRHSALSFMLYRAFPPMKIMQLYYPALKNQPYLLWWCYLKRIFSKSPRQFKKVRSEIKTAESIAKNKKNNAR